MTNSYILEEEEVEAGHGHSRGRCLFELGGWGGGEKHIQHHLIGKSKTGNGEREHVGR